MGRKSAQSFNIDSLFMEGQVDAATRMEIVRSPYFSVIVAAYNLVNGNLRVGLVDRDSNLISKVMLVTPVGLPVAVIRIGTGTHSFEMCHSLSGAGFSMMSTNNFRYMKNKITKSGSDLAARIVGKVDENNSFFSHTVYTMIDRLIDKSMGESVSRAPSFSNPLSMDRDLLTFMARHMRGEVTLLEMPGNLRNLFDSMYKEFSDKRERFREALKSAHDFVQGDRWVLFNGVNGGVILGAISPQPMIAAVENYSNAGMLPSPTSFNYCDTTLPFKWYESLEKIPANIYRELEYSLVMLKTHRGVNELIPSGTFHSFWVEMGGYSHDVIHVVHR